MFLRKIGKLLRGQSTPFQIISATLLGGLLGSLPGFVQAPLLMLLLLFLLMVLNANLFLAGIVAVLARILYLLFLPIYFSIGVPLVEGPLKQPLGMLVNAPVTAWFGLDYYVAVPALTMGCLLGLISGIWMSRSLARFRSKMASLETGSERYQTYTGKFWVKGIAWLFIGGLKGRKSWAEMSERQGGLLVRPIGVVFVIALTILGIVGFKLLDETILTSNLRDTLERLNTATVDIESVHIQASENRIVVTGLAMADPEDLMVNRFVSSEIVADVSGMNLLAKKVVIDSLRIHAPEMGTARKIPGRRVVDLPEPEASPVEEGETIDINAYLGKATVWRDRLATIRRLYEKLAPLTSGEDTDEASEPGQPGWREQLAQRARELGYAKVKSESLVQQSPRLWIRDLSMDNLEVSGSAERYAVSGKDLSSNPALLETSGQVDIQRADGKLGLTIGLPSTEHPGMSSIELRYDQLAVKELEASTGKDLPLEGGTMDLRGKGTIQNSILELPVQVTIRKTTLTAFGKTLPVDSLPLEVRVHGPIDQLKLDLPKEAIESAVKKGGQQALENLILDKAGKDLKKILPFGNGG